MARRSKHFVTVGTNRVHYTRAGHGPAVALFHAAATSLKALDTLQDVLAAEFTVLNFDLPGFGQSDLLPLAKPTIADFADFMRLTLAELGVEQTATYGRHFGGAIAMEYARRHPEACSMALTDGFPIFTRTFDQTYLDAYLPPIVPTWDGSHMTWLWYRCREQHVFWPWHRQSDETRSNADAPTLAFQHRAVVDLLEAGSDYRIGYAAAFAHEGLAALGDLKVPVCFGNRPGDSQFKTMPLYPETAWTEELPRDGLEAARMERRLLSRHPAAGSVPPAPRCAGLTGRTTTDYVEVYGLQILVRTAGNGPEMPIVVIHALPGSSALYEPMILDLARHRRVIAIDLPGHGESDPFLDGRQDIASHARVVHEALDRLEVNRFQLYAHNGGAAVAVEACLTRPGRIERLFLDAPVCPAETDAEALAQRYAPDITPTWEGAHLVRLWHHLRDQEIWWPWFARTHDKRRNHSRLDPARLNAFAVQFAKQPASYQSAYAEVFRYPMRRRLAELTTPAVLISAEADIFAPLCDHAAAVLSDSLRLRIGDSDHDRVVAIAGRS